MQEPGTNPHRPDNADTPASPAPKQVCIISGDPLRPRAFMAALDPALRANEELTIIVDRRRAGSAGDRPAIERRRHPSVDAKVRTDGFAIVPLSSDDPPWIERFSDRQSPDDDAEAGERAIQRILEFKRQRQVRFGPIVGVSAVVGALIVLVVIVAQMRQGPALVTRPRPAVIPSVERTTVTPTPVQAPAAKAPSALETSAPPARVSSPPPRSEQVSRPRDATRAPTEGALPSPRSGPVASPQPDRRPSSPDPAPSTRAETTSEHSDAHPASAPDVAPPPRPRAITPPQPAGPVANAPESHEPSSTPKARTSAPDVSPPRPRTNAPPHPAGPVANSPESHEPSSTPRARTTAPSGESAARTGGARPEPNLKSSMKDLETIVTRDITAAGVEAQRALDEVTSDMRRMWNNTKRAFTDSFGDQRKQPDEAAARARR